MDKVFVESWAANIGSKVGEHLLVYLGLPFSANQQSCKIQKLVVERFEARLAG